MRIGSWVEWVVKVMCGGFDGAVDDMMRLGCVAKAACCCNRGRGTRSLYGDLESRVRQVQIIIWGPFIADHDTLA